MTDTNHHYKVVPIPGEHGSFHVVGRTLFCRGECRFSYQHRGDREPRHVEGGPCPACGQPLAPIAYLVDLNFYHGIGKCGCHRYQFHLQPEISKLGVPSRLAARETDEFRCDHIIAALRFYALARLDERRGANAEQEGQP